MNTVSKLDTYLCPEEVPSTVHIRCQIAQVHASPPRPRVPIDPSAPLLVNVDYPTRIAYTKTYIIVNQVIPQGLPPLGLYPRNYLRQLPR